MTASRAQSREVTVVGQVMDATHDVVVLFYSAPAKATQDMWPYWKKTVERFRLLGADTLRVARYDVSRNQLPESIELESIPGIIIFPAKDKEPPYKMYHGKAKVRPIMYWVQQMARCLTTLETPQSGGVPIEFPNDTPHLDAEQREAYIVQIAERDERVGLKRATEKGGGGLFLMSEAERIARLSKEAGVHAAGENEAKAGGGHTEL
ncbi:hypothetical protein T484DRAFT_1760313 [Baffinella frigidus]|nr:hypothetical protein T484DRAFT_1760313 [Cryptophyta sp. CCMP2293]